MASPKQNAQDLQELHMEKDKILNKYVHKKVILSNQVSVDKNDLLDYVINSVPNETLHNQARIQRFETVSAKSFCNGDVA